MINMFYFGDRGVWLTVINTLQTLTGKRRKPDKTASQFAPKRTYLAMFMYRIADSKVILSARIVK